MKRFYCFTILALLLLLSACGKTTEAPPKDTGPDKQVEAATNTASEPLDVMKDHILSALSIAGQTAGGASNNTPKPPQSGTTQVFERNGLKLEVTKVHSIRKETMLDHGVDLHEYSVFTCYPGATITVLNAGMSDPTYAADGKAHPQWGLYYSDETEKTRISDGTAPIPITSQRIGDLEFSTRVTALDYDKSHAVTYENGQKVISAGPYGLDDAEEIRIYLPGYPVSRLPEAVIDWLRGGAEEFWDDQGPKTLPFFVLYNVRGQQAFFSADWSAFSGTTSSRLEQTNLTFVVEGLEESIPVYLFRDLEYSLYIPHDG